MRDSLSLSGILTTIGSSLLKVAGGRIGSFLWEEMGHIWGVEDELRKLRRTFLQIQDLVDQVESSPLRFSGGSKAWQLWFEDLQKLGYDADTLVDRVLLLHAKYCNERPGNKARGKNEIRKALLFKGKFTTPGAIVEMQKKLEALAQDVRSLLNIEQVRKDIRKGETMERSYSNPAYSHNSSLLVDEQAIVGRQQDKENIIRLLGDDNDALSVIPLVGMAGIGKTTLAQVVFNCQEAHEPHFNLKIWVSVSVDFDVVRITKSIIESATKQTCQVSELDPLQRKLQEILISRGKFLLVLDDYWNENPNNWDLLSAPFRSASKGSKVLVTTRSNIVSRVVGTVEAYTVQELSDEDCWRLMKQRVLYRQQNQSLESLGEEIAKKCKGLPLAAKVLGSVLHWKSTYYEWLCIADSELWDLPQDKNSVFPSLLLSYLHLPPHLQKCFSYCSIFPQNHEFKVEELVLLWLAEGFIQPQGERRLEDIGNEYFNDLHMRSFFQLEQVPTSSRPASVYKMHILIHDLARLVSTNTCFQLKHDAQHTNPLFGNACHLSLHHQNAQPLELSTSLENERLRTFMLVSKHGAPSADIPGELFPKLKSLRVLYLCDIGLNELPDSIDQLMHLRYLNLRGNSIVKLPGSICKLLALQTLLLCNCLNLLSLPDNMKDLSNLRHLMFDIPSRLSSLPPGFGKLTNLQTLTTFFVGKNGIEELEKMDLLRGTLCIQNINRVFNVRDASKANMNMKKYLNKLVLQWEPGSQGLEQEVHVLERLEPHEHLKELAINGYRGIRCPIWLSGSQRSFTRIHLEGLSYCEALPSLGELPFLKSLCMRDMNAVRSVDQRFYGDGNADKFPSLECFEVYQMTELVQWMAPNDGNCMVRLTTVKIYDCPNLSGRLPACLEAIENSDFRRCPLLRRL